jgi:hypothetical protein
MLVAVGVVFSLPIQEALAALAGVELEQIAQMPQLLEVQTLAAAVEVEVPAVQIQVVLPGAVAW